MTGRLGAAHRRRCAPPVRGSGVEELLRRPPRARRRGSRRTGGGAYFALRAVLCSRREDVEAFDAAFAELDGRRRAAGRPPGEPETLADVASLVLPRVAVPAQERPPRRGRCRGSSRAGRLVRRRAAAREGLRRVHRRRAPARARASWPGSPGRAHAPQPAPAPGAPRRAPRRRLAPTCRRTMRSSLRYEGEPVERHWRRPGERPRPLVLVCDVSGSMEPYARMLLQYMQACVARPAARRGVRVRHRAHARHRRAARARPGRRARARRGARWRTGRAAPASAPRWPRSTASTAAASVAARSWSCSRTAGTAAIRRSSRRELARLGRCAHRLVWLNPLKAHPDYEPLTRGMQAALPHVDHFLRRQLAGLAGGAGGAHGGGHGLTPGGIGPGGALVSELARDRRPRARGRRRPPLRQRQAARRPPGPPAARARAATDVARPGGPGGGGAGRRGRGGGAHASTCTALEPVVCARWEEGQSASLACGLAALSDCEAVVVTLGDQPRLAARGDRAGRRAPAATAAAARATYGGRPGPPGAAGARALRPAARCDRRPRRPQPAAQRHDPRGALRRPRRRRGRGHAGAAGRLRRPATGGE